MPEVPDLGLVAGEDDPERASLDAATGVDRWYDADAWAYDPESKTRLIRQVHGNSTELWLRGAHKWQNVLPAVPHDKFVFRVFDTRRRGIRPYEILSRGLPPDAFFEWFEIGRQYVEHFTRERHAEPHRWPVWCYGDDPELLLKFCRNYEKRGWTRIVIAYLPRADVRETRRVLEWIHRVAAAYPHVRLHLTHHDNYTYLFGLNFYSVDFAPGASAWRNGLILPNGHRTTKPGSRRFLKWIHLLGYSVEDLETYEQRCAFNILSARWAALHWNDPSALEPIVGRRREDPFGLLAAKTDKRLTQRTKYVAYNRFGKPRINPDAYVQLSPDPDEPYDLAQPITNGELIPVRPRSGFSSDKIACNSCTLTNTCRYFREGAICGLPGSEIAPLADMFGTRDADVIKDALTAVVKAQSDRYTRSAEKWREDDSDIDDLHKSKHLMAMENSLVKALEVLVKILDPSYRPDSTLPAISASVTHVYNPQVLVANVMKELESRHIDPATLTPEVLKHLLSQEKAAIES